MFAAPLPGMTPAKGIFVPYPHLRKGIFSPALCHFLPMQTTGRNATTPGKVATLCEREERHSGHVSILPPSHPSAEGFRPSADFLSELIFAFQGVSRV